MVRTSAAESNDFNSVPPAISSVTSPIVFSLLLMQDGTRSFRLWEAQPLATSFGADLYRRVFGDTGVKAIRP
jgi:hypothetical protein